MKAAIACCLVACSTRFLPAFEPPVEPVTVVNTPNAPRVISEALTTCEDTYTLRLAENPCGSEAPSSCGLQLRGIVGASGTDYYRDWTDCGTALPPRQKNATGDTDLQDPDCVFEAQGMELELTLRLRPGGPSGPNAINRISVRARDAIGNVSSEDFVEVEQDSAIPDPPRNVRLTASSEQVLITWDPPDRALERNRDIDHYLLYYGTENPQVTPTAVDVSLLNSTISAVGPSPIPIPADGANSLALTGIPNGSPIYAVMTSVDRAYTPSFRDVCKNHESPVNTFDVNKQFATPGEFVLGFAGAVTLPAGREARAVAAAGDLVVLVSAESGKTVVETYDLQALTRDNASTMHVGEVSIPEASSKASLCRFPDGNTPSATTVMAAPKKVIIFDRWAIIATGAGQIIGVDLLNPANPQVAFAQTTPGGCAYDMALNWPYLFVADGTVAPVAPSGRVGIMKLKVAGNQLAVDKANLCPTQLTALEDFNSATAIAAMPTSPSNSRFVADTRLIVQDQETGLQYVDLTLDPTEITAGNCDGTSGAGFPFVFGPTGNLVAHVEMPLVLSARGVTSPRPGGEIMVWSDENNKNNTPTLSLTQATTSLPRPVWSIATAGEYVFVGQSKGRGVDVFDIKEGTPENRGLYATVGHARSLAVAGSYLLIADGTAGLIIRAMHESGVLVNSGTISNLGNLALSGMRAWRTDAFPGDASNNFKQQPLRGLSYQPFPPAAGGSDNAYCFQKNHEQGNAACGKTFAQPHDASQPCWTNVAGTAPLWPARCYTSSIATVKTLRMSGPDLLFGYQVGSNFVVRDVGIVDIDATDGDNVYSTAPTGTAGVRSLTNTTGVAGTTIATWPGYAAFQTAAGVRLIDRVNRASLLDMRTFAGLSGAVLRFGELCGVRFVMPANAPRFAELVCFDMNTGNELRAVSLGNTATAQTVGLDIRGTIAAAVLIGDAGTTEGVRVVDLASGVVASFPVEAQWPEIKIEGPYVYIATQLGMTQFGLRR